MRTPLTNISAIIGGAEYSLTDGVPFYRLGEAGMGHAPVRYITTRGSLQHGTTLVGVRLDPRFLMLKLGFGANSELQHYEYRDTILRIIGASRRPRTISLRVYFESGEQRQIDCVYSRGLEFESENRKGFHQEMTVEFYCPDPTYYDPLITSLQFNLGTSATGFTVPMAVPTNVGSSTISTTRSVTYDGTWLSYPFVQFRGPATNPIIQNNTTGHKIQFTGLTLADGEYVNIDLQYGQKTVIKNDGTNLIANVTDDSDLAEFHIAPAPDAPGGVNDIYVSATSVNSLTNLIVQYNTRYIGL